MEKQNMRAFSWRGFVSVTTGLAFLGLAVTGVVLFFTPPGRVANWGGWACWGLSKYQWAGLHIWFSLLFLVLALVHICYNWKCLMGYFKDQTRRHLALRWEWGAALLLIWVMSAGTVTGMVPFSSFLRWHSTVKHRLDNQPIPSRQTGTDLSPGRGYRGGRNQTALAASAAAAQQNTGRGGRGQGFGQMTLSSYCAQMNLDLSQACAVLEQAGVTVDKGMTLRQIANVMQVHPADIRHMLER